MNKLKGLNPLFTIIDIEKFCRDNWKHIKDKEAKNIVGTLSNVDYSDGIKDTLREILDTYFGGV